MNRNELFETRKYWLVYLIFIVVGSLSILSLNNYSSPVSGAVVFVFIAIVGVLFIAGTVQKNLELYKSVFILLVIVGVVFSCLTPIFDVHDEQEHFIRSQITSSGVLVPSYVNGSYQTIASTLDIYDNNLFKTPIQANTGQINYTLVQTHSAFAQNPFWGYIAPAIGILIAELFSLNAVYLLVFGRIVNSILYAGLVALAIKKAPILKIPLFAMACIPLALHQSFSISIDAFINGVAILTVAYFLYLFKISNVGKREIAIFSLLCLAVGLCKLPYVGLILLLLLIPSDNFEKREYKYYYSITAIIALGVIGVLYYQLYANEAYSNSFRSLYFKSDNVSTSGQINFIKNNFSEFLVMLFHLPNYLWDTVMGLFTFSYTDHEYTSNFLSSLLVMFIGAVSLFYPVGERFSKKVKIGTFLITILIFVGTYLIQFITWTPVGQTLIVGTQPRYFLPLFTLAPLMFSLNPARDENIENYVIVFTMGFIAMALLLITFMFY